MDWLPFIAAIGQRYEYDHGATRPYWLRRVRPGRGYRNKRFYTDTDLMAHLRRCSRELLRTSLLDTRTLAYVAALCTQGEAAWPRYDDLDAWIKDDDTGLAFVEHTERASAKASARGLVAALGTACLRRHLREGDFE
jgi:hypothetical protein